MGLAPSGCRSAGRQWEVWEGLEEHGESQVLEESLLVSSGWGGRIVGRQD